MSLKPEIIFEDQHLIVLSKPAGLLSQGEHTGDENLVDWLRAYVGRNYIGLVHRLDRNTSGLMVVAKRTKAARRLTESLQEGLLERRYLAWLEGNLKAKSTWKHWLLKDEKKNTVSVVSSKKSGAKESSLRVSPVAEGIFKNQDFTLAEFVLETGRSHQIRVQAAFEGFPVAGDIKYGRKQQNAFARPLLHSYFLSFPHPMSGEKVAFKASLPDDMKNVKVQQVISPEILSPQV